nr:competence type IV pilus minor pilin ComGF [Lederbergia lenta]
MLVSIMRSGNIACNNERGFTLIEAILSMLMLSIIMMILPLIFHTFSALDRSINVEDDFEWNLFLIQFRKEVEDADKLWIYSNRIFIDKNNRSIYYEQYGQSIRRRVNNAGHEIVLQQLRKATFVEQEERLVLTVEFVNGTSEEARFSIPLMKEEVRY